MRPTYPSWRSSPPSCPAACPRRPASLAASSTTRVLSPPAASAACIARSRPNAKPISPAVRQPIKPCFAFRRVQLGLATFRPVTGLDQRRRRALDQPVLDLLIAHHRVARLARQARACRSPAAAPDASTRSARSVGHLHRLPGGAGEQALLRRLVERRPVGRDIHATARQLAHHIGHDLPSGPTQKRIRPAFGWLSPVAMHLRSGSSWSFSRPPRVMRVSPRPEIRPRPPRLRPPLRRAAPDRSGRPSPA